MIGYIVDSSRTDFNFSYNPHSGVNLLQGQMVSVPVANIFAYGILVGTGGRKVDDSLTLKGVNVQPSYNIFTAVLVGYIKENQVFHTNPETQLPEGLVVERCRSSDLLRFTNANRSDYLRWIAKWNDPSRYDLLLAHLSELDKIHTQAGDQEWLGLAWEKLIELL